MAVAALVAAATLHLPAPEAHTLELTHEEFQWLEAHANQIRIAPLPDSPPVDFIDKNGIPQGLTSDYIHLIEQQLGIRFVQVQCASWKEVLEKLKNNDVDLVGSIQNTPERQEFLHFTEPYLNLPNVIITHQDRKGTFSLDTLNHIKIAIVDGCATHGYLQKMHPEYTLLPVQDAASGFRMVSFMEADVMVADLGVASYYIAEMGISNLRVAGNINYPWELCLASRKDWPKLNSILNKALANITPSQREAVKAQWITLQDTDRLQREHYLRLFAALLIVTVLTIGAIMLWNRTLRKQVSHHLHELGRVRKIHKLATLALDESEMRFRVLVESSSDIIWEMDPQGNYTYISPRVHDILGYTPQQLDGQSAHSLMLPEDAAQNIKELRLCTVKTTFDHEVSTYLHRNGRKVILESSGMAFADLDGNLAGFRGVSHDITERIKSETALRHSEERFRNLVETSSDWIWEVDIRGKYTYSSPQSIDLLGYTPNELQGRHFTFLMPPAGAKTIRTLFDETVEKGDAIRSLTNAHRHKDRRMILLETSAVPFYDKQWNIQGYRGISRDITNRSMIENSIRNIVEGVSAVGRRFFTSMVSQLTKTLNADVTFIAEFKDDSLKTMRTIAVSDQGGESPNFSFQIDKTPCELVLEGSACAYIETVREKYPEAKILQSLEVDSYIGIPLVDSKNKVLGVMVAMYRGPVEQVELTTSIMQVFAGRTAAELERRQATKERLALRNLLEDIINSMPSILVGVDAQGNIMLWNREAENITGVEAGRAKGHPLKQVFPDLGNEMNRVIETLSDHHRQHHEHIHCTIRGEQRVIDVTVYPITDDESDGAVIRLDDVTDRVRIEEVMVQSEKMMSVGGLAAGMAHEINNPLAGILQSLQVIRNRVTDETDRNMEAARKAGTSLPAIRKYMESRDLIKLMTSISEAGRRASKIVDNMLSFSRKDESHFEPNDLAEIIERSVELASNDYNLKKHFDFRHIQIEREFDTLEPVHCEAGQIQQVVLNLLSNSAQAFEEHPEGAAKSKITLRLKHEGEMALIEVEDNGPGMDAETRKRAFEPFFTTKEVGHGTGLGLSVSYFIVTENHGGTMRVNTALGKGTCFSIHIPFEHRTSRWGLRI